jgi:hypothetical protein
MGSSASFSYWTADEEEANQNALKLQEIAKAFILEHIYYGIPVRCGKASHDPRSQLWIEIDPKVLENAHLGKGEFQMALIETVPSAVSVHGNGGIKIIFTSTKTNIEYNLHVNNFMNAMKFEDPDAPASALIYVPTPKPPVLIDAKRNSISLSFPLPQKAGISQQIELQYAIIIPEIYTKSKEYIAKIYQLLDEGVDVANLLVEKAEDRDVYRLIDVNSALGRCPYQWYSLSTRMYFKSGFLHFTLDKLLPGDCYIFRIRYMNHRAWSTFSYPSRIMETLPAPPNQPDPPVCGFVSSSSIQLFWVPPSRDNGSPIKEYRLRGKSAGGDYVELFCGQNTSYLATQLHPEFIYSFEIAAVNSAGESKWSNSTSVTTPKSADKPRPRDPDSFEWIMALQFRDAWRELWDPKAERLFYFNTITGTRQLDVPEALRTDINSNELEELSVKSSTCTKGGGNSRRIESTSEADRRNEVEFRKKRYHLLRTIHSLKTKSDKNATKSIEIRRSNLLLDGFRKFSTTTSNDMSKRFKFSFTGEPGIDSGGVGKELFLLLSRQASLYASDTYRGWMYPPDEKTGDLFFSDETRVKPHIIASSENENDDDEKVTYGKSGIFKKHLPDQTVSDMKNISADKFCKFLGRILGKALYDRQLVDMPLSKLLLKHMLGQNMNAGKNDDEAAYHKNEEDKNDVSIQLILNETKDLDYEMYNSLKWMAENNITNIIYEKFSVSIVERKIDPVSKIGMTSMREVSLCADGEHRDVTEENKMEYIKLLVDWKTHYAVNQYLEPFLLGFHEIVPLNILQESEIEPNELHLLLNGKPEVDVDELRAYCIYQGEMEDSLWGEENEIVVWFWQVLRDLPQDDVRTILCFFTGSARVPLDGYDPPLNITQGIDMNVNDLPRTHTCFNQLVIPPFESYEKLKEKLLYAARETEGFTLA